MIKYRPDIDGLRAIAVSSVVIYHAFPKLLPGGFVGVDIFFVISGFLITSILLNDVSKGRYSLTQFYLRRIRRVLPALVIVLISTLALGWALLLPSEFTQLGEHATAAVLFASNLALWRESGYFDAAAATKPLLHLWSLGIEEQFYIVWPLLIAGLARWARFRTALLIAVTIASFFIAKHLVHHDTTAAFYSPLSRAWELSVGGLAAMFLLTRSAERMPARLCDALTAVGIGALCWSIATMDETMPFPGKGALLPVLGSVAIVISGARGMVGRYLLGNKVFVAVGLISYPLYLWHWPLMAYANLSFVDGPTPEVMGTIVAASIILAALTYLLVERNVRRLPNWNYAAPIVSLPAMALIAAFSVGIFFLQGMPWRFPEEIRSVLATANYQLPREARYPECWTTPDLPVTEISSACGFAENGKTKVFVWGDSHAASFYAGLKHLTEERYDIAQYTRSSCPPLLGFPGFCGESNRAMLKKINETRPDIVIIDGAWANYGDFIYQFNQADDFRATLDAVKKASAARIVVIGPTPFWKPFLPSLVYRTWALKRELPDRVLFGETDLVKQWDADVRLASKDKGVDFFSVAELFCNHEGCLTHTPLGKDDLIAWDNSHLTMSGAALVAQKMEDVGLLEPVVGHRAPTVTSSLEAVNTQ